MPAIVLDRTAIGIEMPAIVLDRTAIGIEMPVIVLDRTAIGIEMPVIVLGRTAIGIEMPVIGIEMPVIVLDRTAIGIEVPVIVLDRTASVGAGRLDQAPLEPPWPRGDARPLVAPTRALTRRGGRRTCGVPTAWTDHGDLGSFRRALRLSGRGVRLDA
jgi:hypothetical protein